MLWRLMQAKQLHDGDDGGGEGGGEKSDAQSKNANPGGDKGTDGKNGDKSDFKPITSQEEYDASLKDRLKRHEKALTEKIKAELKAEQEAKTAEEQGDYKKRSELAEARAKALEDELKAERLTAMRTRIGAKHKLPQALVNRLIGTTEEDLEADAKAVAKELGVRDAPDNDMGKGEKNAGKQTSDRPIRKDSTDENKPVYTFDGRKKIPFPR